MLLELVERSLENCWTIVLLNRIGINKDNEFGRALLLY